MRRYIPQYGFNRKLMRKMAFVAKKVDMEKKYTITTLTQAFFFYDGTDGGVGGLIPQFCCGPAQGDNPTARNGNSIRSCDVSINYFVQRGTNYAAPVRVMLVYDKQPDNSQVTVAQILDDITAGDSINAKMNAANQRRFWILMDNIHILDTYHVTVRKTFYKKLNFRIRFSGSSGGYNNAVNGGLWFFALSTVKDTTTTTNNPAITAHIKYKYFDN